MAESLRLYAGCQGGVVVYPSHNDTWQQVGHHLPDAIVDAFSGCTNRPERVFAGVAHDGVYRSDDGGKTWLKVLRGDVRSVTVDPSDDDVVYAGTELAQQRWRRQLGGDELPVVFCDRCGNQKLSDLCGSARQAARKCEKQMFTQSAGSA